MPGRDLGVIVTEIDLTDGNDKGRHVQPQGFVPSHLAEPMLRDRDARSTALEYVATSLGEVRVAADILASPVEDGEDPALRTRLAGFVSTEVGRAQRLVKALAVGALALLVVGGVTLTGGGRAEAMEAPSPDPVAAQTVRVVLGAAPVTVWVRASVYTPTAPSLYCGSAWNARGRLGHACSSSPSFSVPVHVDPRTFPVGRSLIQVVDDGTDTAVSTAYVVALRKSRFGVGSWVDAGEGYMTVAAPISMYSAGRIVPQRQAPVQVQQLVAGRWVVKATFTAANGVAYGTFHAGTGRVTVRVVRPAGATVTAATGVAHTFDLTACDPPAGVI